jgi:hypothetical protein
MDLPYPISAVFKLSDQIDQILLNSYTNFHAKGVDYVCIERAAKETLKLYFFEGVKPSEQLVMPHDHRYDFTTTVLAGEMANTIFRETAQPLSSGEVYNRWLYRTPLNGHSNPFEWDEQVALETWSMVRYGRGETHSMASHQIHTIKVYQDTILMLKQGPSKMGKDAYTHSYSPGSGKTPPYLDGLYTPMTADRLIKLLSTVRSLANGRE